VDVAEPATIDDEQLVERVDCWEREFSEEQAAALDALVRRSVEGLPLARRHPSGWYACSRKPATHGSISSVVAAGEPTIGPNARCSGKRDSLKSVAVLDLSLHQ
jgi:hypothetical protein